MHRLLAVAPLSVALAFMTAIEAPPSFAGRWRLDVARSEGMPAYYATVREHRLDISHTDSTLTVDVALADTAGAVHNEQFPYSLRGPNAITTSVRTPNGPAEIDIAREIRVRGELLRPKDHESWRLSADGRELHISREAQMPRNEGLVTYRMRYVFVRA